MHKPTVNFMYSIPFIFIYGKEQHIYYLNKALKWKQYSFYTKAIAQKITGEQTEVDEWAN